MSTQRAIIIGAALIAAAILITQRYEITIGGGYPVRLNTITGDVALCDKKGCNSLKDLPE